jgi:hypothetical protein
MLIITTRGFRANQKKYFDLVERETVFVARKNGEPIRISVANDYNISSNEELMSIQRGLENVRLGKTVTIEVAEEARKHLSQIYKSGNNAVIRKVEQLFVELSESLYRHCTAGTDEIHSRHVVEKTRQKNRL